MTAWGGFTNSCEKKRSKKQRRKGIYTHLNAEFQRIARRDKNAFLSDHCKEIEENNRMGKTWDLFKKIRDTKGTYHAKMGTIKAEDIKKREWEYTEELYKEDLYNPDNHDGVITHLEPDSLECEVKWVLGSITSTSFVHSDALRPTWLHIPGCLALGEWSDHRGYLGH